MSTIMKRGKKFYLRYTEGYRPAVKADGTPKLWKSGEKKGQPKVDENGRPLMELIERTRLARGATTAAEARPLLTAIEARIMRGLIGIEEVTDEQKAQKTITIKELGDKFVKEYTRPKLRDPEKYRNRAKSNFNARIYPHLGKLPAHAVTSEDVERMRDALTDKGKAPASVVQALAALSVLYSWAIKKKLIACANPAKGVERPLVTPSVDFLSKEEVDKLLSYCLKKAPDLYPMVATAVYCGLRKGELMGLRWRSVHLEAGRLDVIHSFNGPPKSGKPRYLRINPELAVVLRQWKEKNGEGGRLVFPVEGRMGTVYETLGFSEILDAAGCAGEGRDWHTLRHTFASHFMMSGGNILTLQKLLGHADIKTTMVYAHLSPDYMAKEVDRMTFAVSPAEVTDINEARRQSGANEETKTDESDGSRPVREVMQVS